MSNISICKDDGSELAWKNKLLGWVLVTMS